MLAAKSKGTASTAKGTASTAKGPASAAKGAASAAGGPASAAKGAASTAKGKGSEDQAKLAAERKVMTKAQLGVNLLRSAAASMINMADDLESAITSYHGLCVMK